MASYYQLRIDDSLPWKLVIFGPYAFDMHLPEAFLHNKNVKRSIYGSESELADERKLGLGI